MIQLLAPVIIMVSILRGDNLESKVSFNNLILNADITINNVSTTIDSSGLNLDALSLANSLEGSTITLNSGELNLNKVVIEDWNLSNGESMNMLTVNPTDKPFLNIVNSVINLSNPDNNKVSLNTVDDVYMGVLNSDSQTKYSIDIIFDNEYTINPDGTVAYKNDTPIVADTITVSNNGDKKSQGVIYLDKINFMNVGSKNDGIVQIIKGDVVGSNIVLAMNDNIQNEWEYTIANSYTEEDGTARVKYHDFVGTRKAELAVSDQRTGNMYDSIRINSESEDTLKAINEYSGSNNRYFEFTEGDTAETYYLTDNTGVTASGKMNVVGVQGRGDVIDAKNQYSMFVVSNSGVELNISDVIIRNAKVRGGNASVLDITNENANVNLSNVIIDADQGFAIYNAGNLTFKSGNNEINSLLTNNGTVASEDGADTLFKGGITANNSAIFNFAGTDVIDSLITTENSSDKPVFNISGNTTVTRNSSLGNDNLRLNIVDSGNLYVNGTDAVINVNGNDTWETTATLTMENQTYTDDNDNEQVALASIKYTGKNSSGNNGILIAKSGTFELVSGVLDILENSQISNETNLVLTTGTMVVKKPAVATNIITMAEGDKWQNANVILSDNMVFNIANGLNRDSEDNSVLNLTESAKLLGDEDNTYSTGANFINKGVTLNVYADESLYKGTYTQEWGELNVINNGSDKKGSVFGKDNSQEAVNLNAIRIQGGSMLVDYTGTNMAINYSNVHLGGNDDTVASFTNISKGGNIDSNLIKFDGTDSIATFISADGSTADDKYYLKDIASASGKANTIIFDKAFVEIVDKQYIPHGVTSYIFKDSVVDFQNANGVNDDGSPKVYFDNYIFKSFSSDEDARFVLDVDLKASNNVADTIEIVNVADEDMANVVTLHNLNFVNVDQTNKGKILILRNKKDEVSLALDDDFLGV